MAGAHSSKGLANATSLSLALAVTLLSCRTALSLRRSAPSTPSAPAILVFGDSIVDPGNNNMLLTTIKCNFPPYGLNYQQGPTGRFSNGRIPSDLIASEMGIKENVPAYLSTTLAPEDLLTGVSFASGGSGFDPLTPQIVSVLSLQDQLELFKDYKEKVYSIAGAEKAASIISESAYVICIGTDDIANTYFTTLFRSPYYDIPSYIHLMVKYAIQFVEELINLGARKIAFIGLPPIGCLPSQRTNGGGITRKCEPLRNQAAKLFNTQISYALQVLQNRTSGTRIIFLDPYDILMDFIENPGDYGFVEVAKGCCGTGEVEVSITCNPFTSYICPDNTQYMFWDSYHPTEKTYRLLVGKLEQEYDPFS